MHSAAPVWHFRLRAPAPYEPRATVDDRPFLVNADALLWETQTEARKRLRRLKRYDQVSAFILTGGASTRMGRPKGLLEFGGRPIILRTARLVEPLVSRVTLIGAPELYATLGLEIIADRQFIEAGKNDDRPGALAGKIGRASCRERVQVLQGAWSLET